MYVVSKQALGLSEVNKRGVYTNDMGASSLGIAYPRQVAERVVEYLDMKSKEPLDVRLMKFTKKEVRLDEVRGDELTTFLRSLYNIAAQ